MRWLGRARALYKLSIGGHSALVSKDHVCESGFPVRNPFAKGRGCSLAAPSRGPRGAGGRGSRGPPPGAAPPRPGLYGTATPGGPVLGGEGAGPGPGQRAGTARPSGPGVRGPPGGRSPPTTRRARPRRPSARRGRDPARGTTAATAASARGPGRRVRAPLRRREGSRALGVPGGSDGTTRRRGGRPGPPSRALGRAESRGGAEEAGRSVCWFS